LPPVTKPQQYQVQFTTSEEHTQLIERAKALMARERPTVTLGELHLEAMKLLVVSLEKRKFAIGAKPRSGPSARTPQPPADKSPHQNGINEPGPQRRNDDELPRQRGNDELPRQRGNDELPHQRAPGAAPLRKRSRYVPVAQRRAVYGRDNGRCTYVDARGERCHEVRHLEVHHVKPFAQGGEHEVWNLTLRCPAHNGLAAEQDFGRQLIDARRDSARHESLARQGRANDPHGR
jgi:5-methylcytosine-specific restriction endonuclease McrA